MDWFTVNLVSSKQCIISSTTNSFPSLEKLISKIEKYNCASNACTLSHADGDWAVDMIFDDVVKLIPKSRFAEECKVYVNTISSVCYESLDTANCLSSSEMSVPTFT